MAQPVLMDFTAVRNASKRYGELADDCKSVYDELQKIGQEFQQAAAMGAVGAQAAQIVTNVLRILMNMRRKKFVDLRGYLLESYVARREGDENAVPEFDSGVEL
jgi:hypothetical protein